MKGLSLPAGRRRAAFSLIELLLVVTIVCILLGFGVSSLSSVTANANLNRAGQLFSDQLVLARQEAISKNRDVEVRFFTLEPSAQSCRGVQLWIASEDGSSFSPLAKAVLLPETIAMSATHSPLTAADTTVSGTTNFLSYGQKPFSGFRFRSNGAVAQGVGSTNNYMTLQLSADKNNPPKNYYAIQLNPFTGRVSSYRP